MNGLILVGCTIVYSRVDGIPGCIILFSIILPAMSFRVCQNSDVVTCRISQPC